MEIMHTLTAANALAAIILIFIGVVSVRHTLRRIILHTGVGHV